MPIIEIPKEFLGKDSASQKTIYHGGFEYLLRIDVILKCLDDSLIPNPLDRDIKLKGISIDRYFYRLQILKALFFELSPKMIKKVLEIHLDYKKKAGVEFDIALAQIGKGNKQINCHFIEIFDEWELKLRRFADKKGLLMPEKSSGISATVG